MKDLIGIKINKLGFHPMKLGDLIYHEGPLLSLFIDKDNPDIYYLYKWIDSDELCNRWLITQINSVSLKSFFYKQVSLRDIILNNPICYSIDLDNDLAEGGVLVCSSANLPNEYLPSEKSFFSEERYSEFSQTVKTMIANNRIYDLLYKILSEIDSIKRHQIQTYSLINQLSKHKQVKQGSYSMEALLYSTQSSNYEKILI